MRVRSTKTREFSLSILDRNIFRTNFPTGFTYRNLYGFARFPGDSTALASAWNTICKGCRRGGGL